MPVHAPPLPIGPSCCPSGRPAARRALLSPRRALLPIGPCLPRRALLIAPSGPAAHRALLAPSGLAVVVRVYEML
eukprot:3679603-Prymnesium_polylepis.1